MKKIKLSMSLRGAAQRRRSNLYLMGDCFAGKSALLAMTYRLAVFFAVAALILFNARQVHGQGGIEVTEIGVSYNFGEQITFQAHIQAAIPIKQVSILFRGVNETVTRVETLQVGENGLVNYQYDASQNILPPFSQIVFWFQATLNDGQTYTSPPMLFRYDDNRFPWRTSASGNVTVHWYDGDNGFGQSALDAAGAGLLSMNKIIPLSLNDPMDIYIYSNAGDLQGALALGGETWAGGHANPKLGVALVALAPGEKQSIEMETEIPHELAHVMLYRSLGDGYDRLPTWLSEGYATLAELYPNPDYAQALKVAGKGDSLLHLVDLCDSFPPDSGRAFLAYAESQSFTRYLYETYGTSGLEALTKAYMDGLDCELGATRAIGSPLSQLDTRWRENVLGQNAVAVAIRNLAPLALLMLLILIVPLWGAIDILRTKRKRASESR